MAYNAGLYLRLSKDDEAAEESQSITTQRRILSNYAESNHINVYDEYIDDGWSGTNFDRPGFQRMISDIESKKINCVIVKDLSRLGRNYIQTGQYTELYFPERNVRFISINDGIDSLKGDDEFAPFRNIINEWYARDISRKIRASIKSQFYLKSHISGFFPLGYRKDAQNGHDFVIDEKTAWIIKRIFYLASIGNGASAIARTLSREKVPCPAWYKYEESGIYREKFENGNDENKYRWHVSYVQNILKDQTYIGNSVHNRRTKESYKSKKKIVNPESEWIVVENTHEGIIEKELFDDVQKIVGSRKRQTKDSNVHVFAGLLKCADCGWSMRFGNNKCKHTTIHYYSCSQNRAKGKQYCSLHYIRYELLYEHVLERIRYWTSFAKSNEEELCASIRRAVIDKYDYDNKSLTAEIEKLNKRLDEIDRLLVKLYEDRIQGNLNERNFELLIEKYQKEQNEAKDSISRIVEKLSSKEDDEHNVSRFVSVLKEFIEPTKLTPQLLNALIEKIVVHEASLKEDGTKEQKIEIYYKFIGKID